MKYNLVYSTLKLKKNKISLKTLIEIMILTSKDG